MFLVVSAILLSVAVLSVDDIVLLPNYPSNLTNVQMDSNQVKTPDMEACRCHVDIRRESLILAE